MKKWIPVLILTFVLGISMYFMKNEDKVTASIFINEVCSSSTNIVTEEYISGDYIELYNATEETVCLAGWMLSDERNNLDKHILPEIYIEAQGYVLLFADGVGKQENTVSFKLSQDGESLFLTEPSGNVEDQTYIPRLDLNHAYARKTDGGSEWAILEGTPGKSNQDAVELPQKTLPAPIFSHEAGYYENEFVLTLSAEKGQEIYYTLDGSMPTENSFRYENGIHIYDISEQDDVINDVVNIVADWKDYYVSPEKADKATVIRAIVYDNDNQCSEVVTKTYIVGLEGYKDAKVLSIVAEPEQLIGENGIFVTGKEYDQWYLSDEMSSDQIFEKEWTTNCYLANFWQRGRKYEVPAEAQFIINGKESFSQAVGLRTQGNYTRLLNKKSLQLFSRNMYSGSDVFHKPIFGNYDSHAAYVSTFPEKAYFMKLAQDRSLGVQQAETYNLFINGEYWYTAVLMEKYDETYFSEHYGVNPENVLCIKEREANVGEEYTQLYNDLLNYVCDESVSSKEKASVLYEQIDVQSFIDWLCFELYICNDDVSYTKNTILWRTIESEDNAYGDCKWRWMLYDIDHAATIIGAESENFQDFAIVSENPFYWTMKASPDFCRQMVITAMDMLNTNFAPENVGAVLHEWGLDLDYGNDFFVKRPEYMIASLKNEFGLSGSVAKVHLTINDSDAGEIQINTTKANLSEAGWDGLYFTDYPVNVTAVANPGYRFVGWTGATESSETSVQVEVLENGTILNAIFEKE